MKYTFIGLCWLLVSTAAWCQDFNNYQPLLPKGLVPHDFTDRSADKFAEEVSQMEASKRRERKSKTKYYLESTFGIDQFLGSGNVLFNDDVSMYLANVLAEILTPYPELQQQMRVYAVKSPVPNAFTTGNGMIFVNLGLLARLENEAQLAFALAHEVVHYQRDHALTKYITGVNIDRAKGDYRKLSLQAKDFAKSSFSRELEMEADSGGAIIYRKSAYTKESIGEVFDILRVADYPLGWALFDKSYFEYDQYVFSDSLLPTSVKTTYEDKDDVNDALRSHPNIKKRKELVLSRYTNGGKTGIRFKVSENSFFKAQKLARYELCRTFLITHNYLEAMVLALSLQHEDPDAAFLQETVAKALYGLAKDLFENQMLGEEPSEWAGEPARLAGFIRNLSNYETAVLALRELNKCLDKAPDNKELQLMIYDLLYDLEVEDGNIARGFLRDPDQEKIDGKIYPYTQYAFLDCGNRETFFNTLDEAVAAVAKDKKEAAAKSRRRKKKKEKKEPLNVSKVVVVSPYYRKIDTRRKQKVRHIESEEVLTHIDQKIWDAASELGMKADIINPNNLTSAKVEVIRSNSLLNDWMYEQMQSNEVRVSPIYNEINALGEQYGTEHFVWMGQLTLTRTTRNKGWLIIVSAAVPAFAPMGATLLATPRGRTLYYALAFNVRTQGAEVVDMRYMKMRDTQYLLRSNIYYTLFQLKKGKL